MVIQCLQWIGALLASARFLLIGWGASLAPPPRFRWRGRGPVLVIPLLLVGTTSVGWAGPFAAPRGFPLVPPAPPPAPAIGSHFAPTQFLATSSFPTAGWPGPALSAFPWIDIGRTGAAPRSLTATDPVLEALGVGIPTLRMDRLVLRVPALGFVWPTAQSGRVGGQLWLVFGGSPMGPNQILQGPRAFPAFTGAPLGNLVTVSPVMTPAFFFVNAPPKSYAFDIILTDLDGVVRDFLDPLMIVGGVPPNTAPTFPIAHWILMVKPGQPVRQSLPPDTAVALRKLGVALRRGSPSFVPGSTRLCPTEPPAAGLPPLLKLDLETGELSASTVVATPGVYCATYDAHNMRRAKVAELAIIVTVSERLAPGELKAELLVDRGCGSSYRIGELLTINYGASHDALVTLKARMPGGSEQILLAEQAVPGGVTQTLQVTVGEPLGTRQFILEVAAGDQRARAECAFTAVSAR